jgi:rubrerythrin
MKINVKKALEAALDFERKGEKIYRETASKTKNPLVARTFMYLAEQELNHINEIKGYMEKEKIELKGDTLAETKKFFSTTISKFKEKALLSDNDLRAHETALELEQKSYNFYKEQAGQAHDPKLKKLFRFLMEQENAHYMLIQKAYDYIKDPVNFYVEEERWMFDGG